MQGGDRSKIWTCSIFFFWKERTSQDIGYVLPKYENGQIRRNQRRSDLEKKNLPEASVIRWSVTEPYENNVLEELDIWDLQWLIFVLKPHKTSIAVDLVFFNLYLQICIIITTVRLKIKKDIVCTCYIYLRAPLIMHATKSPGRPGRSWNTSITKCGKSWNTKTTVHDRGMFIHMYTVTCFLMNNFKSCLHKKSRRKIILFFTEMRKIRISWL